MEPPVQLINSFPPPTAIWRYARLAKRALGDRASLATVRIGNLDFTRVDQSVSRLFGFHTGSQRMSGYLNFAFAELAFRELTQMCRVTALNGGVTHYLAEDIRPWFHEGKIGVVVHGNPRATIESDRFYSFGLSYKFAVKRNLRQYSRLATALVQSQYVKMGLEEFGYEGPIRVVPPAVDPVFRLPPDKGALRRRLGLPEDRKLILSISTAEKRKNLAILPKVMDRLPSIYQLLRIGPPVRGSIPMSGLSDQTVADLYGACDVLLFPTLEEGFGLPVIEAFASGLPVVASDIDVMREVCGGEGLLVDPTAPDALAKACIAASSMPEDMIRGGCRRAEDFSFAHLQDGLNSFFHEIVARS